MALEKNRNEWIVFNPSGQTIEIGKRDTMEQLLYFDDSRE